MAHDVFITYSSHDKSVAEAVCATLESRQIPCWIAPRDVLPGMEWAEAIVDALDRSLVLILVLSSNSNSSPQVIREVGRAASKGIPIIPLRIDDAPLSKAMEFFVSSHHFLDAQTPPLKKHLQRLADTVQQLLTQERESRKGIEIAEEKPAEDVKVEKPLLKRPWLWAGVAAVLLGGLVSLFLLLPSETPTTTPIETPTPPLAETAVQYYNSGVALSQDGQYDQAISEFNQAIELDPGYADAYYNRGVAYRNQGEHDLAIADFTRAIELDPNDANAYNFRGNAYHYKGEYDQAIADYTKAIEINPNYTYAYHDRGLAYYYKGEYDMAITDLTKAIEIDPNNANFYYLRGYIYRDKGEYDKAIADLEKCIEVSQDPELIRKAEQALGELRP